LKIDRKAYFLEVMEKAEKRFGKDTKRLAGDAWPENWQTVIATLMSAQTRDEVTIPVADELFARYSTLQKLANAKQKEVLKIIRRINFSKTKSKNVIGCAKYLLEHYNGIVPDTIEELVKLPGVGRKTANLVIAECYAKEGICVDTHVHRISNVLGIVKTKSPTETEFALREIAPKKYWSRINRLFVLWGKTVRGKDKKRLLEELDNN
jgi:endonuclease-3